MLFSGAISGVLCYNVAMSLDLIVTLRNPLIPGKARMKYYHLMTGVIVVVSMAFNAYENSKYNECEMDAVDYMFMVWNFGLLTVVYLMLLGSAVVCVVYIGVKKKEVMTSHTKAYFKRHVTYSVVITSVWTVCIMFFWIMYDDRHFFDSKDNKKYFILVNLVLISVSGAVQAFLRNWEPAFWNCSKSLCRKKRNRVFSSLVSSNSSVLLRDSRVDGDMWNMPMSFIIQENMKTNTTLCILTGVFEAIRLSETTYSDLNLSDELKTIKKHKISFKTLRKRYPTLKYTNHPYFLVEEYAPKLFKRLRLLENSPETFLTSLNPSKNEKVIFSPNTEQGGSGSLIIFTEDNNLVLKIFQESERKALLSDFLLDYLDHIECNCSSQLNRIFGVFTIKIPGLAPLEIIMSEGLNSGDLLRFYDLKGSRLHRGGDPLADETFKGPFKDNDFISSNEMIVLEDETVALITCNLMSDFQFLLQHDVMDYSVILSIFSSPVSKSFPDKAQIRHYRLGIIDYLDKYSFKRKAEYYLKKIRYGKRIRMCSVMKPINYYERIVRFVFQKVILMRR
jgi:hypothetical protein